MTQDFGLSKLSQRFSRWFAIGLLASSSFSLFADQCELYPITLPTSLFANNPDKLTYEQVPLGTGPGNYSWLTWDGANDAPSLAQSLIPPGDSERYQNPEQADDNEVSIGDWVQGRPGVKNSRDIRDNLTALLGRNIRIPAWSSNRGQGSLFDYQTGAFIEIELTDFKLNGKGWISFIYKGPATCESTPNSPPVAENLNLQVEQDTALGITVIAADADDDPLTYRIVQAPQNGTLTGNGPDYVYTPNPGFIGSDSFSFVANDGQEDSNIAVATISVTEIPNSPPVAENLNLQVEQDTALGITVIATDADADPLTYRIEQAPQNGTLTGTGPDYIYTPDPGFIGTDSFSFVANDGQADSNVAVATIAVTEAPNNPPIAEDLNAELTQDTSVDILVIASDADEDVLSYLIVLAPVNGTLTGNGPNYVYTPDPGFIGSDSFSFVANDGKVDSNVATATITVSPAPNNPPVAEDLQLTVTSGSDLDLTVIANDLDEDPLTYVIVDAPQNGTLSGTGPDYVYTPDPGFVGDDSFSFLANDGQVDSNIAVASITVAPLPNNPPVAENLELQVTTGSNLDLTVIASDLDDDPLTYVIVDAPQNGTLSGTGPDYVYTPNPGFIGDDSFSFLANDGQINSNIALASITVSPLPNNPPVAEDLELQVTTGNDLDLTVIASDLDDDPLSYVIVDAPQNGTLSGTGPDYVYTPDPGFVGDDSFSFLANDGQDNSNVAVASITVAPAPNNPPIAENLELQTPSGEALNLTVVASDADLDPLTYQVLQPPQNGTLSGTGPDYVYTPDPGFIGTDSFSFVASDGQDFSNEAFATIEVIAVNNNTPPVAEDALFQGTQDVAIEIGLFAVDEDNDPLVFIIVNAPLHGELIGNGPDYLYVPDIGYVGDDSFSYKVNDGQVDSNTANVSITISSNSGNSPPIAEDRFIETQQESSVTFNLFAFDPDQDPLTFIIVSGPLNGVLSVSGTSFTYTPNPGFVGSDFIEFKANDGQFDSNVALIEIDVQPIDD